VSLINENAGKDAAAPLGDLFSYPLDFDFCELMTHCTAPRKRRGGLHKNWVSDAASIKPAGFIGRRP
jgi:hypothetical protein